MKRSVFLVVLVVASFLVRAAPNAGSAVAAHSLLLGRSEDGRPIVALRVGDPHGPRVLVFGCIHGNEFAGLAVVRALERVKTRFDLWLVPNLNPDGYARGTRQNGRGVDLNANWSSQWQGGGRPWDVYYRGPHPFSERETRIARNLILSIRPRITIWFHQHMNLVWAWGPSSTAGRIYARAADMRFYHHHWLHGTATNWQNNHLPGSASFTVELPAGSLTTEQVRQQVHAVLTLAAALSGRAHASRQLDRTVGWTAQVKELVAGLPISVSVADGTRLVYAHAGDVPRAPASNEKLFLSMALLDRFGPDHRIPTTVEGAFPKRGLVNGNIWLVGHGDPEFDDAALARLAAALRKVGIRSVRGSVVGVTNTFTRERWAPGWRPIALQFIGLPTALTIDGNSDENGFVFDPERRAAATLTADLRALGVRVAHRPKIGPDPSFHTHVLARVRSPKLVDLLRSQNVDSSNLDAEVLTKMLGAAVYGHRGSIAKGARAIQRWARHAGVTLVAHDGSGLSYADGVSSDGVVRLLSVAARQTWGTALRSSLPSAGEGTLTGRLLGLRVHAKTGTLLQRVSALSGWIWLQRTRRWAEFSILSRGLPKPKAVALEDAIVTHISEQR